MTLCRRHRGLLCHPGFVRSLPVATVTTVATAAALAVVVVAIAMLAPAGAARANDVDLVVTPKVAPGQKPTLTVKVSKDLKRCTLDVRGPSERHRQTLGPQSAGGELSFVLPHTKPGRVSWSGSLAVVFDDGAEGSMPLQFGTEVLAPFRFEVRDVALDAHHLTVVSEHDTAKVELEVYGDDGELLAATGAPADDARAGTPVRVEWIPKKEGPVLRLHVVVHDVGGAFQTMDLFPYNIAIPHEEVEFQTGKHEVRASEEPKLQAALVELERAVQRYSAAIRVEGATIRLFVAGHTDTVGPAAANRALSERRARAIATWFEQRGVKIPIYARGFGEDLLKVQTPDDTDEQRNRRVDYDVGVNGPTGSLAGWTRAR